MGMSMQRKGLTGVWYDVAGQGWHGAGCEQISARTQWVTLRVGGVSKTPSPSGPFVLIPLLPKCSGPSELEPQSAGGTYRYTAPGRVEQLCRRLSLGIDAPESASRSAHGSSKTSPAYFH